IYDGMDIIRQTSNGVNNNYVRMLGIDEPLSKDSDSGEVVHFIRDGLGSIIGLLNDSGNSISSMVYDVFGGTPGLEEFGFTGRENDGTGLMYFRARYYSPEMRRFISRDPLGFA